jgi:hypothetical protein
MPTTATLVIGNFTTSLYLGEPGGPREKVNVIGDKGDDYWAKGMSPYFRRCADAELAKRGYTRAGDWAYDAGRDQHTATITANRAKVERSAN